MNIFEDGVGQLQQVLGAFLQWGGGLYDEGVVNRANLRGVLFGRYDPADAPAAGVGGFGDGVDDDGALGHSGECCGADVDAIAVEDVFVDFVGD